MTDETNVVETPVETPEEEPVRSFKAKSEGLEFDLSVTPQRTTPPKPRKVMSDKTKRRRERMAENYGASE